MKKSSRWAALFVLALMPLALGSACKPKKIEVTEKKAADSAPLLRTDIWQGTEDKIDPQLGAIKTMDK